MSADTYYPFGVEPYPPADTNHYKFSGKERDTESGNDYFGARYYGSTMGRFLSPDFSDTPQAMPYAELTNPQSFNRYVYLKNNPLSGIDPDGHNDLNGTSCGHVVASISSSTRMQNEIKAPCKQPPAPAQQQSHLSNAAQALKAAVKETTAKVTIGLGLSLPVAKVSLGSVEVRAEVADKDNLTFSNGKIAISNTMEGGVSIGAGSKQFGLAGSSTKEAASYDMKSNSFGGSQSPETEWTVGGRSGGTLANASRGSLTTGTEVGEGVLGGGSISISSTGMQDMKNAWQEIKGMF